MVGEGGAVGDGRGKLFQKAKRLLKSYELSFVAFYFFLYSEGFTPEYFLKVFVKKDILLKPHCIAASFMGEPFRISSFARSQR